MSSQRQSLQDAVYRALMCPDPAEKCRQVRIIQESTEVGGLVVSAHQPARSIPVPGRPDRPELVDPHRVPRRRLGSAAGRIALIHAVAHIEFNAINLALDAVYRFGGMPEEYYSDWLSVAVDEARHFQLLGGRLQALGAGYGDLSAHNGLWEMALATDQDCLTRMALVPRVLEARGLDVTPGMIERLTSVGDTESVKVLSIILEEEVRHVEIGTRWFRWCCKDSGVDPQVTFSTLMNRHCAGRVKPPFNYPARQAAGFNEQEMAVLESMG